MGAVRPFIGFRPSGSTAVARLNQTTMDDNFGSSPATVTAGTRPLARKGLDPRAYRRLAAAARKRISGGALSPGEPLPSITERARGHGHARVTCAKAYRMLETEGLVTCDPGLGYYVT